MESQRNRSVLDAFLDQAGERFDAASVEDEDLFEALGRLSRDGVLLIEVGSYRFLEFNDVVCGDLGYSREEFASLSLWDLQDPSDRENLLRNFRELRLGAEETFESRQRRKDGTVREVQIAHRLVRRGGRECLLAIWRDVTQRRLREQQNFNQSYVLGNVRQGVVYTDQSGLIRFCNPAYEAMFGYGRGELLGRHVSQLNDLEGDENENFVKSVVASLDRTGSWRGEVRNRRKDGSRFYTRALVMCLPFQGEGCWVSIQEDITEERWMEARLREHELLLDLFFNASPSGMALFDQKLRCLRINATQAALHGAPAAEIQGRRLSEVRAAFASVIEQRIGEVLRRGVPILNFELRGDGAGARRGDWLASFFPVHDASGGIWAVGAVVTEITERRRSEQALRLLSGRLLRVQDEERRRMARELHDTTVQNLAVLCMDLSLLETHLRPEQVAARSLVGACSGLAGQCVSEIRTFSYLLHPPLLEELGLSGALSDFATGFARRTGIRVSLDLPKDMSRLSSDAELALFRVAQESLANVLRHSGSRTASLRLGLHESSASLEISDAGQGCRVPDEAAWNEEEGAAVVGVGIAGMRERIRQLGGRFEMESGPAGTVVRAFVPLGSKFVSPCPVS